MVPQGFYQLLITCAVDFDVVVPTAFTLMMSKSRLNYDAVFSLIKEATNVKPTKIVTDFEAALCHSQVTTFEGVDLQGCYFHASQAIYRRAKQVGLDHLMNNSQEVKEWVRLLMSLPLLPANQISNVFQTSLHPFTLRQFQNDAGILSLYEYVDSYWLKIVGVERMSVFRAPRRTNATVKSFNNTLKSRIRLSILDFGILWIDSRQ